MSRKRGTYHPEVGYNYWKHCKLFKLDKFADNYEKKQGQVARNYKPVYVVRKNCEVIKTVMSAIVIGDKVEHSIWGRGTVVGKDFDDGTISIDFLSMKILRIDAVESMMNHSLKIVA